MSDAENADGKEEMSFLGHLEALRWHLIRSVIAIIVFAIAAFSAKEFIFDVLIFGPKQSDFATYIWLCKLSYWLHDIFPNFIAADSICIGQDMPKLQNITMIGQFMTHIMVSLIVGLIVGFPYIMWEVWRFIRPALKDTEKKFSTGLVFFTSLLFACGVLFGYYIVCPLSVNFFFNYQVSEEVINVPTLATYISTVTTIVLACGIVFELPILVFFLSKLGLVTPAFLRKYRKHAFVGSLVLSAIITPPDVFSQCLVSIPMMILYEISIFISKMVEKKANADD